MRLQKVDQFYQVPARCFLTGSAKVDDRGVLDTGHFVEGEGRVYLSADVVEEVCRLWGWVPPDEAEVLTVRAELAEAEATRLNGEIEQLEAAREAIQVAAQALAPAAPARPSLPGSIVEPYASFGG